METKMERDCRSYIVSQLAGITTITLTYVFQQQGPIKCYCHFCASENYVNVMDSSVTDWLR